jgi:carbon starvation protein
MLTEGMLAVFVLICCGAGLALGLQKGGETFTGVAAFSQQYAGWAQASGLGAKIGAFVQGAANMIERVGIPLNITLTVMGVFVVSFAATTLDTATRLQRYVVAELAGALRVPALGRKHPATLIAVGSALLLAFHEGSGKGALKLWPLFGSVNQLLAGLALLVITVYLARRRAPLYYTLVPMAFMIAMTGWAMLINLGRFAGSADWMLLAISACILVLEVWMLAETVWVLRTMGSGGEDSFLS